MPTAPVDRVTGVSQETAQGADLSTARPSRSRVRLAIAALVLLAGALALARAWPHWFGAKPPENVILASGRIEGRDVTIAPKDIQGRVMRLLADEGQTVAEGQLLAELEARQLEARAASLTAAIAAVDAQIQQAALDVDLTSKNTAASIAAAEAGVSVAQAQLVRTKAVLANASADCERERKLFNKGVASGREMDQSEMALRTSEADVEAAAKGLARAQADLALAVASKQGVALKQQQVRTLQENRRSVASQRDEVHAFLAERRVVAPSAGTILSRPVEVGDVVSPGSALFRLVDLNRLYVKVYLPEPQIPKLRLGDAAEVRVDAFPDRRFQARVSKIYDQAEFTPKNVETSDERLKLVFGVELALVNPDRLLKPGMPADCFIRWAAPGPDARHGS